MKQLDIKRLFLLWGLSIILPLHIFSQQDCTPPNMEFGQGVAKDLAEENYDIPDNEEAVMLFKKGHYAANVLGYYFSTIETIHKRIKILNTEGLDRANVKILAPEQFFDEVGVKEISAASYTLENGQVSESILDKKDIFKKEVEDGLVEYSFAIPNVKVGSIIEYKFKVVTMRFKPPTWFFDDEIPVLYSQVSFNKPDWQSYTIKTNGNHPFACEDMEKSKNEFSAKLFQAKSMVFTWSKANLPAFIEEDHVLNIDDYRDQIQFWLKFIMIRENQKKTKREFITTWEQFNEELVLEKYGPFLQPDKKSEKLVEELTAELTTSEEIIKALYDWVNQNIELTNDYSIAPHQTTKEIYESMEASVTEKNLLLNKLLLLAGFNSKPLLVKMRGSGMLTKVYASSQSFSYPIVYLKLGEKELFMNASFDKRPYYLARLRDYNNEGLLIQNSGGQWIDTYNKIPISKKFYQLNYSLTKDGAINGTVKISENNYLSMIDRIALDTKTVNTLLEENFSSAKEELTLSNTEHSSMNDAYKHFVFNADFEVDDYATVIKKNIYLSPLVFNDLLENPYDGEKRNYPIDIDFPYSKTFVVQIEIPEGYTIEEVPESALFTLGDAASYKSKYMVNGSSIIIQIEYQIKGTFYSVEDSESLKIYFQKLTEELQKPITLSTE